MRGNIKGCIFTSSKKLNKQPYKINIMSTEKKLIEKVKNVFDACPSHLLEDYANKTRTLLVEELKLCTAAVDYIFSQAGYQL